MDKVEKLKSFYKNVRDNPHDVSSIIEEISKFRYDNIREDERLFMSYSTLDNDLRLQYDTSKNNIERYKKDLSICIDNNLFSKNEETPFKIFEIIAKVQYANNLLVNVDNDLKELYDTLLVFYYKEFPGYFSSFTSKNITYERIQSSFTHNVAFLFIPFYDKNFNPAFQILKGENLMESVARNRFYETIFFSLIFKLKEFKHNYYNLTWEDIEEEGFKKYDFIYKEDI